MKIRELLEGEVKQFPTLKQMIDPATGKKVTVDMGKATPVSMVDAFGSRAMKALNAHGISLAEKPSYWEELNDSRGKYRPLTRLDIKRIEKDLGDKIRTVDAKDVYGTNTKPKSPLARYAVKPTDDLLIVQFDGGSYLIDTTQAETYARMWAKIEDAASNKRPMQESEKTLQESFWAITTKYKDDSKGNGEEFLNLPGWPGTVSNLRALEQLLRASKGRMTDEVMANIDQYFDGKPRSQKLADWFKWLKKNNRRIKANEFGDYLSY